MMSFLRELTRLTGAAAACIVFSQSSVAETGAPNLDFGSAFTDIGEPAYLHYQARYTTSEGVVHRIEVWRDGRRQLRRSTDDGRLEVFVQRDEHTVDFEMQVLDSSTHIVTRIDRSSLCRVGSFTDWFDLAHVIKYPVGTYRLVATQRPAGMAEPVAACDWFAMTKGAITTHICWSSRDRIPLAIVDSNSRWAVTVLDRAPILQGTFDVHDAGFVLNDAKQDLDRD